MIAWLASLFERLRRFGVTEAPHIEAPEPFVSDRQEIHDLRGRVQRVQLLRMQHQLMRLREERAQQ